MELGGKSFWISRDGKEVERSGYYSGDIDGSEYAHSFTTIIYKRQNEYGIITKSGHNKTDTLSTIWENIIKSNFKSFVVLKNGKYGMIDNNYKIIIPLEYDSIYFKRIPNSESDHFITLKKEGKYGFANSNGMMISEAKYYKPKIMKAGYTKVWYSKCKWGYIDNKGQEYFERRHLLWFVIDK